MSRIEKYKVDWCLLKGGGEGKEMITKEMVGFLFWDDEIVRRWSTVL